MDSESTRRSGQAERGGASLRKQFQAVRAQTRALAAPLTVEDHVVQTMPDVSPTAWHLAHTTWFFENFVLRAHAARVGDVRWGPHADAFHHLFNSYYETVGKPFSRPRRGTLSRPTVGEIVAYRDDVDRQMRALLQDPEALGELAAVVTLGLHHEQQHQELILTDIKHVFWSNPLRPVYRPAIGEGGATEGGDSEGGASEGGGELATGENTLERLRWLDVPEGLHDIGHGGREGTESNGFAFDNESPRHRIWLPGGQLADRLVTNGEFLEFLRDGGYARPELWLADGWQAVQGRGWRAPLYWEERDGAWHEFTLGGTRLLQACDPVVHVSYYEADAFARWAGARLPAESEWEVVARAQPVAGNFVESQRLHPSAAPSPAGGPAMRQAYGDVWEWTASSYAPYPGYCPAAGALGEYNGKFMCSQLVLRGGSCATSASHVRSTYRNFFPPDARWQFMGVRLAR